MVRALSSGVQALLSRRACGQTLLHNLQNPHYRSGMVEIIHVASVQEEARPHVWWSVLSPFELGWDSSGHF